MAVEFILILKIIKFGFKRNELVDRGIPKKDIVIGYQPPYLRHFTDYAVG
ncbi:MULTISPECIES: element excision factor XisI family protein [unclassified Nostoc]|nr:MULTISPECIES: element excision factor XisI family protein [unclassified Nostoc]